MAKTTKKQEDLKAEKKTTAVKKTVKTVKKEVKKAEPKKEPEKITAKKELEKIAAKPEPEKIAAKPEPEKIAAKPEPEKIETKKVEQLSLKEEPVAAVKKEKAVKKPAAKKAAAKKAEKPVATKAVEEKKPAAKAKAEEKAPKKAAVKKTTTKKAAPKKAEKVSHADAYQALSLDECIVRMQTMGVGYRYEDYTRLLMDEADNNVLVQNIIEGNNLKAKGFTFETEGYDEELVSVTLSKVMETMDLKAADYATIKAEMEASLNAELSEDAEKNAADYLKEFKLCEKILMIGQRKNVSDSQTVSEWLQTDVNAFVAHFFDLAYAVLPSWQYDDVKFYEDFAFALLSQYTDLYQQYQLRILIDIADLYIKHGDFHHGDVSYGYILRDNQIKDYIYYRFAHVYEDIDFNKAKSLAYEALQYVDGRYTYYQNIMDIINK